MKKLITFLSIGLLACSAYAGKESSQLEMNKENVVQFYNAVINQKDFETAKNYLGSHYTQHNPTAADGKEGLGQFIQFLKTSYPAARSEIKRVIAEGDYVILHVHSIREPGTRGRAIFDLFKLEKGKIVEHWDTVQDVPE